MAIMIWIQTGLALVIFSAALRGIPKETLKQQELMELVNLKSFFQLSYLILNKPF